jgi:hypothetical protein
LKQNLSTNAGRLTIILEIFRYAFWMPLFALSFARFAPALDTQQSPTSAANALQKAHVLARRFILVFDDPDQFGFDKKPYEAGSGCTPLPLSDTNLKRILQGINEDYSKGETVGRQNWKR